MSRKNVRLKAAAMSIVIAIVFSFRPYGPNAIQRLAHFEPRDIQIRDAEASLGRFAAGLHFKTVSNSNLSNHITDQRAFKGLHDHLRKSFPKVHRELQLKKVPHAAASMHLSAALLHAAQQSSWCDPGK
jgi:hypothetical protein